jgi:hypothetical protein
MNATTTANVSMKTCSRCDVEKLVEDFQWKNRARGIRRSWCRSCAQAYSHQHYLDKAETYKARRRLRGDNGRARVRARITEYLNQHPCVDCGETSRAVLEFDHRDPTHKRMAVSRLVEVAGWRSILQEVEKCDVRCANCHRKRTAAQFGWAKLKAKPDGSPAPARPPAVGRAPSDPEFLMACTWCNQLKPLSEFAFKNAGTGRVNGHCRSCHAAYRHHHYQVNRDDYFRRAIAQTRRKTADAKARLHNYLLAHPCVDCGETNVATLDFDHVDPSAKTKAIGTMVGNRTWLAIQLEMSKCEVRCANCHRRRTNAQIRAA